MAVPGCRALLQCTEVQTTRLWPLIERDWLRALSMSPLQQRPTRHRRASIAMQWQVLERECSSRMPCPDVAVDARGPCAHYTDWRPRSRHQHLLCGLSWLTFVSQPTRSPCPARVPPTRPFPTISQLAEAANGPIAGLAAARVPSGDVCPGCSKATATAPHAAASFPLQQLL